MASLYSTHPSTPTYCFLSCLETSLYAIISTFFSVLLFLADSIALKLSSWRLILRRNFYRFLFVIILHYLYLSLAVLTNSDIDVGNFGYKIHSFFLCFTAPSFDESITARSFLGLFSISAFSTLLLKIYRLHSILLTSISVSFHIILFIMTLGNHLPAGGSLYARSNRHRFRAFWSPLLLKFYSKSQYFFLFDCSHGSKILFNPAEPRLDHKFYQFIHHKVTFLQHLALLLFPSIY